MAFTHACAAILLLVAAAANVNVNAAPVRRDTPLSSEAFLALTPLQQFNVDSERACKDTTIYCQYLKSVGHCRGSSFSSTVMPMCRTTCEFGLFDSDVAIMPSCEKITWGKPPPDALGTKGVYMWSAPLMGKTIGKCPGDHHGGCSTHSTLAKAQEECKATNAAAKLISGNAFEPYQCTGVTCTGRTPGTDCKLSADYTVDDSQGRTARVRWASQDYYQAYTFVETFPQPTQCPSPDDICAGKATCSSGCACPTCVASSSTGAPSTTASSISATVAYNLVIGSSAFRRGASSKAAQCHASTERRAAVRCCADATTTARTCANLGWKYALSRTNQPIGLTAGVCASSKLASGKCPSNGFVTDYAGAEAQCRDMGARLCTAQEVEADMTKGSGCNLDSKRIWTASTCSVVE